jgi:transcriptional regulator of aromatic amino acid metabolism
MLQLAPNEVDTHPFLLLWLASQRPQQHFLLRCEPDRFESVAAQVSMLGVPPVRLCRLPGRLQLPQDKRGTLLLNDVAALGLADQIALYDWLGTGAGDLRVISVTTSSLAPLVARGAFLEGLFHRLGAVQFDLTSPEGSR